MCKEVDYILLLFGKEELNPSGGESLTFLKKVLNIKHNEIELTLGARQLWKI